MRHKEQSKESTWTDPYVLGQPETLFGHSLIRLGITRRRHAIFAVAAVRDQTS